MTSNRPYRPALPWDHAGREIVREAEHQFDPGIVAAFVAREPQLSAVRREFAAA
jgi:HD-GYP domain-containing protein (c-di-GMP phosphodiesterase class II)